MPMKTETSVVDLDDFLPADVATIEIERNGNPTGWKITLAGPSHEKTLAWSEKSARKALQRQRTVEQAQVNGKKYKAEEKTPEEQRRENVEWIVARIVDWTPVRVGGVEYPFTQKAAEELLVKPEMGWAFTQIVEQLEEEKAFTKRSATS